MLDDLYFFLHKRQALMKPSDLFGVIIRTIGLLAVIQGAWYLVYGFLQSAGTLPETEPSEAAMYFASGLPFLVGGCFFLRGADWIVKFSYPMTQLNEPDEATNRPSST
jgi:hypothetical protein